VDDHVSEGSNGGPIHVRILLLQRLGQPSRRFRQRMQIAQNRILDHGVSKESIVTRCRIALNPLDAPVQVQPSIPHSGSASFSTRSWMYQ
jgi:hypothetical protein